MQQIDLATVKASKAADRKSLAILAYDNACADPAAANWRSVADILRLAIPATKAKAATAEIVESVSRFSPWAEHEIPVFGHAKKFGKSPIIVFQFADGETVRAPAVSLPGKPVNLGRALKVAFAYYRGRMAHRCGEFSETAGCVAVPEIVSAICETTGAEYDPAECNARTAEFRAGSFDVQTVKAASLNRPERSDDGTLTRVEYFKAAYRLAVARLRLLALPEGEDQRDLAYQIEKHALLLDGWTMLQIKAKWRADDEAARKPAAPPPPVAPSFKVRPLFLASTSIAPPHVSRVTGLPVAPSRNQECVLRIVA